MDSFLSNFNEIYLLINNSLLPTISFPARRQDCRTCADGLRQ